MNLLLRNRYLFPVLAIGLAALLILFVYLFNDRSDSRIKATWLWDTSLLATEQQEILAFASDNDVNLIYLQIDKKLDQTQYHSFIRAAHQKGITIHAMGGSPEWAYRRNKESITDLVAWVEEYNRSSSKEERFQGIHVDIEPYLLPEWKKDQDRIVGQWVKNMKLFVTEARKNQNMQISAALPFWLDNVSIEEDSGETPLSNWMMERLDHVTLMAYRDYAEGKDGILNIVEKEIKEADELGKSVVIGVEIAKSSEGKQISFHDRGITAMGEELDLLHDRLRNNPSFAGVAIHDFVNWRRASESPKK